MNVSVLSRGSKALGLALLIVAMLCSVTPMVRAGEQRIVLRDYIKQEWKNELVTYPFKAEKGQCHPDSIRLLGPKGPMPVQLSNVSYWQDTPWVKAASISFVTDLAANATHTYTLAYGTTPTKREPVASDLQVKEDREVVEILTGKTGIRMLLGEMTYDKPIPASKVPGPVVTIRLADGTWFGGSRLYGPARVKSYRSRLLGRGPVFAKVHVRYEYEDGRALDVEVRLWAADSRLDGSMNVTPYDREAAVKLVSQGGWGRDPVLLKNGWELLLSPGMPGLRLHLTAEFYNERNPWGKHTYNGNRHVFESADVELAKEPAGNITYLSPWRDWWDGRTQVHWVFNTADRGKIFQIKRRDAGAWVEPAAPGTWPSHGNCRMTQKYVPVARNQDGSVGMRFNLATGRRAWVLDSGNLEEGTPERTLERMNEYVLDWPGDPKGAYPRLFMSGTELEEVRSRGPVDPKLVEQLKSRWSSFLGYPHGSDVDALGIYLLDGSPEMAAKTKVVERLRHHLGLMGNFDRMRSVNILAALYDALIDTDLITPAERKEFRSRMAFLGYLLADPATWSMERGYCSGNQNMSVSYIMNTALIGCLLPDHPKSKEWVRPALFQLEQWMSQSVGPAGEWPESVCNYAHVSASCMLPIAIAARNAGYRDYVNDPRMKKLFTYLAKQYTPPESRSGGQRTAGLSGTAPLGRAGAGSQWGLAGLMARATRDSDPAYSRHQQWSWKQTGFCRRISSRLGGYEYVYLDDTLASEMPDWGFDYFPRIGAIMRYGIGTRDEYYINFIINNSFAYPSESGGFPCIFAKGVPIAFRFAGTELREELLISRVLPARGSGTIEERENRFYHQGKRKISRFSTLPRQDYVQADLTIEGPKRLKLARAGQYKDKGLPAWPPVPREGKTPIGWRRQVLFVKAAQPAGVSYLVLRDTVSGGQPTMWQFWTVSEKIGTPTDVHDLGTFLADKPGDRVVEPRELKGNRFTAIGPFGVDTEFFVARPAGTARHTLRWGKTYEYSPIHRFSEYLDMLHLQMADDGAYFVAIVPRRRNEPVPEFSSLCDGRVIKVSGTFGADYVFLSGMDARAQTGQTAFSGTVASVQDRKEGLVLSLGARGSVRHKNAGLTSEGPAGVIISGKELTVLLQPNHEGQSVTLTAKRDLTLKDGTPAECRLERIDTGWVIKVPAGTSRVVLRRKQQE